MKDERTPAYWLRQRNGQPGGQQVNAYEAAMIAQRVGGVGDHLSQQGLVWSDRDPGGPGGFSYYTLTPVYKEGT
ncbi:hypothetical protein KGQ20_21625 [Catenulispora sp. NF23]|uniref:Uncharacterized protein n=1 Tax=Catenulispora pinistramenti TaxID=2705254 RepID=A0ABS5KQL9_9ACTN|nr:hypothetical protein [Catenulispora pinistramenti]MBS2535369.1 hypothetical protein [Catenulispora pinistramenti]MBS2548339.1 hypothetical protein [Catenulispora pinistramenti]